jgi:metallo-beta-lactamase class B
MKMNQVYLLLLIISGCNTKNGNEYVYTSDELKIKPISDNAFMHISYLTTNDFGKVECNGMIYLSGSEAIVFDTPTNDKASAELIDWIEAKKVNIKAVVATHFHNDCLGGLQQFHNNGTKSYANFKTIELADSANLEVLPQEGFNNHTEFKIGNETVYATFYGAGHTADNVVGYLPNEQVLFGGCLIKTMNASKGFLGDADTLAWTNTVDHLKRELPNIKIVIPGHGSHGGKELLDYTSELFRN